MKWWGVHPSDRDIIPYLLQFLPFASMKTFRSLAILGLMATSSLSLFGQLNLVTSRANFPTTDTVNWSILGPPYTTISSPFTVATTGGSTVTVSHDAGGLFERRDQGIGWPGNFPAGSALLWNRGDNGAITFNPAQLISGAGFNVQSNFPGEFTFRLDAYGAGGNLLGSVTESGFSGPRGAAIFIGFTSPATNVDWFVGTLVDATLGVSDFAINTLALAGSSNDSAVPVPEPSFYGMAGALVILGLAGRGRLRRLSEV